MQTIKKIFTPFYQVLSNGVYYVFLIATMASLASFITSTVTNGEGVLFGHNPSEGVIFGYKPIVVLTGSMETEIKEKSLIIGKQVADNEVYYNGDIITYSVINDGREVTITHRIIEVDNENNTVWTKGDNNSKPDAYNTTYYPDGLPQENIKYKIVYVMNWIAPVIASIVNPSMDTVALAGLVLGFWIMWKVAVSSLYDEQYEIKFKKAKKLSLDNLAHKEHTSDITFDEKDEK